MNGVPNAVPISEQQYALVFDNGYHEDVYREYPPQADIDEARAAAPDAWTCVEKLEGGRDRFVIHQWPPLNSDPRAATPNTEGDDGIEDGALLHDGNTCPIHEAPKSEGGNG